MSTPISRTSGRDMWEGYQPEKNVKFGYEKPKITEEERERQRKINQSVQDVFNKVAKRALHERYEQQEKERRERGPKSQFRDPNIPEDEGERLWYEVRKRAENKLEEELDERTCIWCGKVCESSEELEQHESEHDDD